jgi:glycosyltransferase involved in cell wall biosynthesis
MPGDQLKYALITAARNEERFLENTIRSVAAQTVLPTKWVIVSDGSTDRTDDIVKEHAAQYGWMELMRMAGHREYQFAAKVQCIRAAWERLGALPFDVIGNLDADITFDGDYMAFLLEKLARDPRLGVVGTRFTENGRQVYDYKFMNENHVSGGFQVFRRTCFEQIGGYLPMPRGGEDWAAVTSARMKGWRTQSYTDKLFVHHRPMGTSHRKSLSVQFHQGERDYLTGGNPLWQFFRSVFQMSKKPYFVGGLLLLLGFAWAFLRRVERPVPKELIRFHRAEQMARLRGFLFPGSKRAQPELRQPGVGPG